MDMDEEMSGSTVVLQPKGRLDSNSSKAFEEHVMRILEADVPSVVIDFAGLDYISSAGLRVLLMAAKRSKAANGRLALCALSSSIREVFDMSGFGKLFAIFASKDEALAHVG